MFDPTDTARVFGVALGVDFPKAVVDGLIARLCDQPPEAIARVQIYVNTSRMQLRLRALFAQCGATFMPRIQLLTQITEDPSLTNLPPKMPSLRRRLMLAQLVRKLLKTAPDIAPEHAAFDLADSLASLLDEMQGEGVDFEVLRQLDVAHHSAHWERSLRFLTIVETYLADQLQELDAEARQDTAVTQLTESWQQNPPTHPVFVVGSTGSRGATAKFMHLVAGLPQGAIILPGYDFDMPDSTWEKLGNALSGEDHPQFRFKQFRDYGIRDWGSDKPNSTVRNSLVSLALRPAPVTDAWLTEGPKLGDLIGATQDLTLIEANSQREESLVIALALRHAIERGKTAALITPDRDLSRQVTAALDRWGIIADDSGGLPLHLSPPGRFLRLISGFFGQPVTAETLLILLKHPLTCSVADDRGAHLRWVRELELQLRRKGPAFPAPDDLLAWGVARDEDGLEDWVKWINACFEDSDQIAIRSLADHLTHHMQMAESIAAGPNRGSHQLWEKDEGIKAAEVMKSLTDEVVHGGDMAPFEYASLILSILQGAESRSSVEAHPDVMIWGTLEARVQGAEMVVLGGLNDGIWPSAATPDPWLNRSLRNQAGLLLPERRIGLAAHDFQQAIAAPEVILTRAIRNAEAETVPSRWVYRLTSLLDGLKGDQKGDEALREVRKRGAYWLNIAAQLDRADQATTAAPRPSPQPPVSTRPTQLSITEIEKLILDPYSIYAKHILKLSALDPLRPSPDARLRGVTLHRVFQLFSESTIDGLPDNAEEVLLTIADQVFAEEIPWPATRRIWRARLVRNARWFIQTEVARRAKAQPSFFEISGQIAVPDVPVAIKGKVDRIDVTPDGQLVIFDYKTGTPPSHPDITRFNKQMLIEAAMAEEGAFAQAGPSTVSALYYIGFGRNPKQQEIDLAKHPIADVWQGLSTLLAKYQTLTQGYTSRRPIKDDVYERDYNHLARLGEWDLSDPSVGQEVRK